MTKRWVISGRIPSSSSTCLGAQVNSLPVSTSAFSTDRSSLRRSVLSMRIVVRKVPTGSTLHLVALGSIINVLRSAPAERGRHVLENRRDAVGAVLHAELVGDGQQQRVRLRDGLVLGELLDQAIGFIRVGAAEDGAHVVDLADVVAVGPLAEVHTVFLGRDREDAAAHRHARRAGMARDLPGLAVDANLLGLLHVEGLVALVLLER